MPTLAPTWRPSQRRAPPGFTLLEILIVVFLIGVVTAALVPRLNFRATTGLRNASRVLNSELRYASERAIATGESHRLVVDLSDQIFRLERIEVELPEGRAELPSTPALLDLKPPLPTREFVPVPGRAGEWRGLDDAEVRIESVTIGDDTYDLNQIAIRFLGDGSVDPAEIRLVDDLGGTSTLELSPFTGEVEIFDPAEPGSRGT